MKRFLITLLLVLGISGALTFAGAPAVHADAKSEI
jgi:hypothetical protein